MKPLCRSSFMATIIYVKHLRSIYVLSVKYKSLQTQLWVLAALHSLYICYCSFKVGQAQQCWLLQASIQHYGNWGQSGLGFQLEANQDLNLAIKWVLRFCKSLPRREFPCRAKGDRETRAWRCRSHASSRYAVAFPYGTEHLLSLR